MKRVIIYLVVACCLGLSACEDFTEIQPKGKNLLTRVTDLDMLLNYEYSAPNNSFPAYLVNDLYPMGRNIPDIITATSPGLYTSSVTWDESIDRAGLAASDGCYTGFYRVIGRVANPILQKADAAQGDRATAMRYKAEAYVLRAYYHYLLVNYFAAAYDPATAAQTPGIPYVFEEDDIDAVCQKYTVAEVYEYILDDIQAALDLNSLPDIAVNQMRVGKAFAYAVQAKVLMSMWRYKEAAEAANKSLTLNSYIYNHRENLQTVGHPDDFSVEIEIFVRPDLCEEDLFCMASYTTFNTFPAEWWEACEEGGILQEYIPTDGLFMDGFSYTEMFHGLPSSLPCLLGETFTAEARLNTWGLTTVDMYLTLAECELRGGNIREAMENLDIVREKRIREDVYQPLAGIVTEKADAIKRIKQWTRTECPCAYRNFVSLKRWNKENGEWKEELHRKIEWTVGTDTKEYEATLATDSPLWIFPFPQNATDLNPNLTQNYK